MLCACPRARTIHVVYWLHRLAPLPFRFRPLQCVVSPLYCTVSFCYALFPWLLFPHAYFSMPMTIETCRSLWKSCRSLCNSYRTSPKSIRDLRDTKAWGCSVPSAARSLLSIDHWTRPITDLDYSKACHDVRSVQFKQSVKTVILSAIRNEWLDSWMRHLLNDGKIWTLYLLSWSLFHATNIFVSFFRIHVSIALLLVSFVHKLLRACWCVVSCRSVSRMSFT